MDLGLRGKRTLITGGSRGIGRVTAMALAAEGCDLVLVVRDGAALREAPDTVRGAHQVRMETITADLSMDAEVRRVAEVRIIHLICRGLEDRSDLLRGLMEGGVQDSWNDGIIGPADEVRRPDPGSARPLPKMPVSRDFH